MLPAAGGWDKGFAGSALAEVGDRFLNQGLVGGGEAEIAQLIGIDPDFKIHVSRRILDQKDGPTLEALKRLHSNRIHLPSRGKDHPDRDRLAMRFELFKTRT